MPIVNKYMNVCGHKVILRFSKMFKRNSIKLTHERITRERVLVGLHSLYSFMNICTKNQCEKSDDNGNAFVSLSIIEGSKEAKLD